VPCAVVVAAVTLALSGCGSPRPTADAAASTATDFYDAIGRSDGTAACDLLAPATLEELESDADEPCDEALLDGDVGETLTARADPSTASPSVAGRQAQVLLSSDVVFLTISGSSWLITAAGCDERPHRPYDCAVEGT
jgi:hypothetical protein